MASSTPCQTDGAVYGFKITEDTVMCMVELPFHLDLDEDGTELLRANLHNASELVLARYFPQVAKRLERVPGVPSGGGTDNG